MNIVDTIANLTPNACKKRVESTADQKNISYQQINTCVNRYQTHLAALACSTIQLSPVTTTFFFFTSITLPAGIGTEGTPV